MIFCCVQNININAKIYKAVFLGDLQQFVFSSFKTTISRRILKITLQNILSFNIIPSPGDEL